MFQGVNRQPRQPDFPPPNWERGHMIIADRYSTRVAGLPPGIPWTPEFWLWLPYKGRKAETKEDWRQRLGDKRPYAEDPGSCSVSEDERWRILTTESDRWVPSTGTDSEEWALEDYAAVDSFGEPTRAAAIVVIADAAVTVTTTAAATAAGEPTARPHRARRLLRQTRRSSSDSPSETSSTTSTDADSTDMKKLFTDLSTVAAATAAADAADQDDSDDTRARRALLRPKKKAKACDKRMT